MDLRSENLGKLMATIDLFLVAIYITTTTGTELTNLFLALSIINLAVIISGMR